MIDPVVATLRYLQSDADNHGNLAPIHYQALSKAAVDAGQPAIGYKEFVARWNDPNDPIHSLVSDFDGQQITLKTDAEQGEPGSQVKEPGTGMLDRTAKSATKRAEKNPFNA
jgi:hypothetical protein